MDLPDQVLELRRELQEVARDRLGGSGIDRDRDGVFWREGWQVCAEAGVLGALAGTIGSLMACEAVKLIVGAGEPLDGRLLLWDALDAQARTIGVKKRPGCPVCAAAFRLAPW